MAEGGRSMGAMPKPVDPYRVLGVSRGADVAQIKAAHRRLAKRHHPDAPGGDEARFVAIQEAYQLLSDPLRRREWDRRHAPGPVDARERGTRASARAASARWTREDAGAFRRTRTARGASGAGRPAGGGATSSSGPGASGREAGTRRATWSAEGVPWWEDFVPKGRAAQRKRQAAAPDSASSAGETRISGDMDAFTRSSGAAWSSAARRHFRRDEATLPSRGAFRYRGTQVVTGAEARTLAEEEAARQEAAAAALFRRAAPASSARAPRQAFEHDAAPTSAEAEPTQSADVRPAPLRESRATAAAETRSAPAIEPRPAVVHDPRQPGPSSASRPLSAPDTRAQPRNPRPGTGAPSVGGPIVLGAAAATVVAAIPVVLGASSGAVDPAAPPAIGTLVVGALVGGISGWLLARARGHATR